METAKTNLLVHDNSWLTVANEKKSTQNYQSRTRLIAYLNIVYFSVWLLLFILSVLTSIWSTALYIKVEIPQAMRPFPNLTNAVNFVYIWSGVVLFGIEVICQLIASFFLLSSTEVDAQMQPAVIQARVWRNVTIGYTIANSLNAFIAPQILLWDVVFLLVLVYMIYVVHKYIKQLEKQSKETIIMELYTVV